MKPARTLSCQECQEFQALLNKLITKKGFLINHCTFYHADIDEFETIKPIYQHHLNLWNEYERKYKQ